MKPMSNAWMRSVAVALVAAGWTVAAIAAGPVIDIWYGGTQSFGQTGNPQVWVNILGNASDPDGVTDLSYTLNGGSPQPLSMGPNTRRLLEDGDFNVEIATTDLIDGVNTVNITATDSLSETSTTSVTLMYSGGNVWPVNYDVVWNSVGSITDAVDIVDGKWFKEPNAIRTTVMGYDRTFVLGDLFWTNYEITVPITIHAIDPNGFVFPSVSPGLGWLHRWTGHTTLVAGEQPHQFWEPSGGGPWWDAGANLLRLSGPSDTSLNQTQSRTLAADGSVTYLWKAFQQTLTDGTVNMGFKVWEQGTTEPSAWDLEGITPEATGILSGSAIFVAHHVDASFGDIQVRALSSDTTPPVISAVQVLQAPTSASVRWSTDELATGSVDYGLTNAYELGTVQQPVPDMVHAVTLPGLVVGNTYFYRINAVDGFSNPAVPTEGSFLFTGMPADPLLSDDFSSGVLDPAVWEFRNPLGDATLTMDGSRAVISIPPGDHDFWDGPNTLPRIYQSVSDVDFTVEVKFQADLTQGTQTEGILIEQSDTAVLRIEFEHIGGVQRLFVARIVPTPEMVASQDIVVSHNMYLRVARSGDQWTVSYSYDGLDWTEFTTFTQQMIVNGISAHAGNDDTAANTVAVDYVFNADSPIVPDDGVYPLVVDPLTLPSGEVGVPYPDQQLTATGGVAPYTWSVIAGDALPPGLTLSPSGLISGTPTTAADYSFTVEVTDAEQSFARSGNLSVTIAPPSTDTDGDGVADYLDNCVLVANGPLIPDAGGNSQLDTDGDGYGNICDGDFDNTGFVGFPDLSTFKAGFGTTDQLTDMDGNGFVNFADLALFKASFGAPPGPSGVAP